MVVMIVHWVATKLISLLYDLGCPLDNVQLRPFRWKFLLGMLTIRWFLFTFLERVSLVFGETKRLFWNGLFC